MKGLFNVLRPLLADVLSTVFFVVFYAITGSVRDAIILAIVVAIAQIGYTRYARKPIAAMQWMSLALVIVLGGAIMLKKGWMSRYLPKIATDSLPASVSNLFAMPSRR